MISSFAYISDGFCDRIDNNAPFGLNYISVSKFVTVIKRVNFGKLL